MIRVISGCLFLTVVLVLASCGEVESAQITEAHVKDATERKQDVRPSDRIALSYPMQCDATATHSGTPGQLPRTRCYVRKESK